MGKALEAGGVRYGLSAENRAKALSVVISALGLPSGDDRDVLHDMLLARGDHAMTPVGDGIAIPHVRQPAVMAVSRPVVTLMFFTKPVDLGAPDGKPVGTFFFILSPTVRAHLHILSRLAAALHDEGFKRALARQASPEEILGEVRRIEGAG